MIFYCLILAFHAANLSCPTPVPGCGPKIFYRRIIAAFLDTHGRSMRKGSLLLDIFQDSGYLRSIINGKRCHN